MFRTAFLAMLLPLAAGAQIEFSLQDNLETSYGPITVQKVSDWEKQAFIGPYPLPGVKNWAIFGVQVYRLSDGSELALLLSSSGGNACGGDFHIVELRPDLTRVTALFGTCAEIAQSVNFVGTRFEIALPSPNPGVKSVRFVYENGVLTEETQMVGMAAEPAGAEADVTRWLGGSPAAPFKEPTERKRFSNIMSVEEMDELAISVQVSSGVIQDGAYVYGEGCWPHQCNFIQGIWVMEIATGHVWAAMRQEGRQTPVWGDIERDGYPPPLRRFVFGQ